MLDILSTKYDIIFSLFLVKIKMVSVPRFLLMLQKIAIAVERTEVEATAATTGKINLFFLLYEIGM